MITHQLLFGAGIILWIMFCIYVYQDRRQKISGTTAHHFSKVGVDPSRITHDDDMWYYDGLATCVGYGTPGEECAKFKGWCTSPLVVSSDKSRSSAEGRHGSLLDQALEVKKAIDNGGTHPECPLLFVGAS